MTVAALVGDGVSAFGLGVVGKVFANRGITGLPAFEVVVCAERAGDVVTDLGVALRVRHGLEAVRRADVVMVVPSDGCTAAPDALTRAVRGAHERGAVVAGFCTGTFVLAASGVLEGRRAATHWSLAAELAARHPGVEVVPEALYVDEGSVLTGAGAAAGIDLCLHLLRREYGAAAANAVAREVVVAPHRDGGQAQYVPRPVPAPDDGRLGAVLQWVLRNLERPLTVKEMAARAGMSPRTFVRRFAEATGTTPHAWVRRHRLDLAEELLERTDLPVEQVACRAGFGSASVLRESFARRRGVSPRAYRQAFTATTTAQAT
ncbi:GlxA family transcriptional regulator [Nonomuraea typhae]|uniref:GlxA family transcriptional regulator n=1 Tax=Nonomuraea typhae TaxID=2603600 RepID=UPI001FE4C5AA|nr:helix-turn-helix domain-containing protein [Nonomuraea typhae]